MRVQGEAMQTNDKIFVRQLGKLVGKRLGFALGCIAVAAALGGCDNDLPVASVLERTRVIGARVEVAGDPGRAEVSPGEAATVSFAVAGPSAPATLDWGFALCTGAGGFCRDTPQSVGTGSGTPVVVSFTTPDAATLGDDLPNVIGVVCADGTIGVDAAGMPTCTGAGASGTVVRFVVPVAPAGATPNRHPALANDVLELGGVAWDAATATATPGAACDASAGLPVVAATAAGAAAVKQQIRLVTDADDRDTFTPTDGSAARLEDLQISNFTTAGKFDSNYAAVFATDTRPDADVTVKWTPPAAADVPAGGEVVLFHFAVRDLRGGFDVLTRALCVTP
jgi:hypothetical protein